jgi:hypothetical protein
MLCSSTLARSRIPRLDMRADRSGAAVGQGNSGCSCNTMIGLTVRRHCSLAPRRPPSCLCGRGPVAKAGKRPRDRMALSVFLTLSHFYLASICKKR